MFNGNGYGKIRIALDDPGIAVGGLLARPTPVDERDRQPAFGEVKGGGDADDAGAQNDRIGTRHDFLGTVHPTYMDRGRFVQYQHSCPFLTQALPVEALPCLLALALLRVDPASGTDNSAGPASAAAIWADGGGHGRRVPDMTSLYFAAVQFPIDTLPRWRCGSPASSRLPDFAAGVRRTPYA